MQIAAVEQVAPKLIALLTGFVALPLGLIRAACLVLGVDEERHAADDVAEHIAAAADDNFNEGRHSVSAPVRIAARSFAVSNVLARCTTAAGVRYVVKLPERPLI